MDLVLGRTRTKPIPYSAQVVQVLVADSREDRSDLTAPRMSGKQRHAPQHQVELHRADLLVGQQRHVRFRHVTLPNTEKELAGHVRPPQVPLRLWLVMLRDHAFAPFTSESAIVPTSPGHLPRLSSS